MTYLYQYIHCEFLLPRQVYHIQATNVVLRASDTNGDPIGKYDYNSILNTLVYGVMFLDGSIDQYYANLIADNLYIQVD